MQPDADITNRQCRRHGNTPAGQASHNGFRRCLVPRHDARQCVRFCLAASAKSTEKKRKRATNISLRKPNLTCPPRSTAQRSSAPPCSCHFFSSSDMARVKPFVSQKPRIPAGSSISAGRSVGNREHRGLRHWVWRCAHRVARPRSELSQQPGGRTCHIPYLYIQSLGVPGRKGEKGG